MKNNFKFLITALLGLTLMSCSDSQPDKTDLQELGNAKCQKCFTETADIKVCETEVQGELQYLQGPCSKEFNDLANTHYSSGICEKIRIIAGSEYHKCVVEEGKKNLGNSYEYVTVFCAKDDGTVEPNCEVNRAIEGIKYIKCLDNLKEYYTKLGTCQRSDDPDGCAVKEKLQEVQDAGKECVDKNYPVK